MTLKGSSRWGIFQKDRPLIFTWKQDEKKRRTRKELEELKKKIQEEKEDKKGLVAEKKELEEMIQQL